MKFDCRDVSQDAGSEHIWRPTCRSAPRGEWHEKMEVPEKSFQRARSLYPLRHL